MLAERLLAKPDFDTDTEVRTLEHLKKRFGETNLHSCEVSDVSHRLTERFSHILRLYGQKAHSYLRHLIRQ